MRKASSCFNEDGLVSPEAEKLELKNNFGGIFSPWHPR